MSTLMSGKVLFILKVVSLLSSYSKRTCVLHDMVDIQFKSMCLPNDFVTKVNEQVENFLRSNDLSSSQHLHIVKTLDKAHVGDGLSKSELLLIMTLSAIASGSVDRMSKVKGDNYYHVFWKHFNHDWMRYRDYALARDMVKDVDKCEKLIKDLRTGNIVI